MSMIRLRDRNRFIPGGFRFIQPQLPRWSVTPWSSFDTCVQQIIQMRQANPLISANNGLSTDKATVEDELDAYNARICQEMKWSDYIWDGPVGSDPPPKSTLLSQLAQSAARVAAGVSTIKEWDIEGGELVPQAQAEDRAKTCVPCPKNGSAILTDWFTVPAAELIKAQLEKRNEKKIRTANDPLLGTCTACACPLKLKVHTPLSVVLEKIRPDDKAQLDPNCWILKEESGTVASSSIK